MNLYYTICEYFDEGMLSVEFKVEQIEQYNEKGGKYIAIVYYCMGNDKNTCFDMISDTIISLDEIYKNWCERCLKDLKENNNMDWWEFDLNGKVSDERCQEIEKIIKEKYKNIYEDYEDYE